MELRDWSFPARCEKAFGKFIGSLTAVMSTVRQKEWSLELNGRPQLELLKPDADCIDPVLYYLTFKFSQPTTESKTSKQHLMNIHNMLFMGPG